jgi:dihydrofolate synthase / folylpolyglutamate synthase
MAKVVKNYQEACDFLFQKLPMFTRIGAAALKPSLENIEKLCAHFDNPQKKYPIIHVAGTNGKGTVSHITAAMLQSQGLKVGLHTSPHYKDLRERFKVNGKLAPKSYVTDFVNRHFDFINEVQPSFFEITVAMSFHYFAFCEVDFAVIEVGLGGRLDSTNVVNPILSVITNISFDHTDLLGDTLHKIAAEKAGIIKSNTPVIIGEYQEAIIDVFTQKAKSCNSRISWAKDIVQLILIEKNLESTKVDFTSKQLGQNTINFGIIGPFQEKNIYTSLAILDFLYKEKWIMDIQKLKDSMPKIKQLVKYIGRWQIINKSPLTIADSGHNEGGLAYVIHELKAINKNKLHIVIGFVADKVRTKIYSKLPQDAIYYFVKADLPRALDQNLLREEASIYNLLGQSYPSVKAGLKEAQLNADTDDLIFVGGSIFVVSEVL